MPCLDAGRIISELLLTLGNVCIVSLQTPYGLIIEIKQDTTLTARLQDGRAFSSTSSQDTTKPGLKYRMFPDCGTDFMCYDSSWGGSPKGAYIVDEEELTERYGGLWCDAYDAWVEKQEVHFGSQKQPFPDIRKRKSWVLEDMLLATWLCLQPDVDSVEYAPDKEKVI
jgi:hypothetical protein